jgi:Na+-driven multidrug efflux pump
MRRGSLIICLALQHEPKRAQLVFDPQFLRARLRRGARVRTGARCAMTFGMIVTIGGVALLAAFAREPLVGLLARSEKWRQSAGKTLEVGGALLVFLLGVATLVGSLQT